MLTVILAPLFGVMYVYELAFGDFWDAYEWEGMNKECSMKYVGKQPVDPDAYSIPFTAPNGEKYILWKQVCQDQ